MWTLLICALTFHQAHAACVLKDLCTDNKAVQNEIVDQYNKFRRSVEPTASNMLEMSYSEEVAASAQAWVDGCIQDHGPPASRMIEGYQMGENLFSSSVPISWTEVISAWHGEVQNYLYPKGSINGQVVGHYTQVVWYSSYKVGCGIKLCPENIYFYSCHYYRVGNVAGLLPYKAGPPCASCPDNCNDKLCTNPCPVIDTYSNCPSLVDVYGCSNNVLKGWCPASCTCSHEIIAIA